MSEPSFQQFMQYSPYSQVSPLNNNPQTTYPQPILYPPSQLPLQQQQQQQPSQPFQQFYPSSDQQQSIPQQIPRMHTQPQYPQNYEMNPKGYYYPPQVQSSMYIPSNPFLQQPQVMQNLSSQTQVFMQDQYSKQFSTPQSQNEKKKNLRVGGVQCSLLSQFESQHNNSHDRSEQEDGEVLLKQKEFIPWKKSIKKDMSSSSNKDKRQAQQNILSNNKKNEHEIIKQIRHIPYGILDEYFELFPGKPPSVLLREYCQKSRFEFEIECIESETTGCTGFLGYVVIQGIKSSKHLGKNKKEAKESAAYANLQERCDNDDGLKMFIEQAVEKEMKVKKKFKLNEKEKNHHRQNQGGGGGKEVQGFQQKQVQQQQSLVSDENNNYSNYNYSTNYRDLVGDLVQNDFKTGVNYEVKGEQNTWEALCTVGSLVTKGKGTSKKDAKNQAAFQMLINLKKANQKTIQKIMKKALVKQKIQETSEKLKELETLKTKIAMQSEEDKKHIEQQQEEEEHRQQAKLEADAAAKQTKGQYSCPIDLALSSPAMFEIKERSKIQFINSHLKSYARRQLVEEKDYIKLREMYDKLVENKGKFKIDEEDDNNDEDRNDFLLIDFAIVGSHEMKLLRKNSMVIDVVMCYQQKEEIKKYIGRNSMETRDYGNAKRNIDNNDSYNRSLSDRVNIKENDRKDNSIIHNEIDNLGQNIDIINKVLPIITQIFPEHEIYPQQGDDHTNSTILITNNNNNMSLRLMFDNIITHNGCYGQAIHTVLWMVNFKNLIVDIESPCNRVLSIFRSWKRANKELDNLNIAVVDLAVYCASNRFGDCSGDCVVRVFEFLSHGGIQEIVGRSQSNCSCGNNNIEDNGNNKLINIRNLRNLDVPNVHRDIIMNTPKELLDRLQQAAEKVYRNNDYNFIKNL